MAKKNKTEEINNKTAVKSAVKSLFDGKELTGKPLSEYNRPATTGVKAVSAERYVEELRSARQLTDKDYSIRINARG